MTYAAPHGNMCSHKSPPHRVNGRGHGHEGMSFMPNENLPLCECGCGTPVDVYKRTRRELGHVKGQPARFIAGHNRRRNRPLEERFWERVDKNAPNGCWVWVAGKIPAGYGSLGGVRAHRFAYELLVGPIPAGLELDHLCRNRACVNPAHLEPVTHHENILRGQSPAAKNAGKTHCVRGHEYSDENTYVQSDGSRRCRKCARITKREWAERTGKW